MYRPSMIVKHSRLLTKENPHKLIDYYEEIYQYERSLLKPNIIYNCKLEDLSSLDLTSIDSDYLKNIETNTLQKEIGFVIQECTDNYVILDIFNADNLEIRVGDKLVEKRRNIKVFVHENIYISIDENNNPAKRIIITPKNIHELDLLYT